MISVLSIHSLTLMITLLNLSKPVSRLTTKLLVHGDYQWDSYADPEYLPMYDSDQLVEDLEYLWTHIQILKDNVGV